MRGRIVVEDHERVCSDVGILVENGTIMELGEYGVIRRSAGNSALSEFDGIICPGLINSHTHLELSTFHAANFPHKDFADWVMRLMDVRSLQVVDDQYVRKCVQAKQAAEASGTSFFVNVGNDLRLNRSLGGNQLFEFEQVGINESSADLIYERAVAATRQTADDQVALGIHSPYSVSPALMKKLKCHNNERDLVTSIHLSETRDEVEFTHSGQGRMAELLDRRVGTWKFSPAGVSPVRYVDSLGILDNKTLCVHCVFLNDDDARLLADRGSAVAICVRSNRFLSGEIPPLRKLLRNGARILVGTDSTASSPDLDMFAEAAAFYHEFHDVVTPTDVFKFVTTGAADFFGVIATRGRIAVGTNGPLVFVPFEGESKDALEFLVTSASGKTKVIEC